MEKEEPDEREISIKEYIKNGREINATLRLIIKKIIIFNLPPALSPRTVVPSSAPP